MDPARWCTFSDESYNEHEWWVVGMVIRSEDIPELASNLRLAVENACSRGGCPNLTPTCELHGHELAQGKGAYEGMSYEARIALYASALSAIAQSRVHVTLKGVDRERLLQRYNDPFHPHQVVTTYMLEDVHAFLAGRGPGHCTTITMDENESTRRLLQADLRRHREHGTWGFKELRLERVRGTMEFRSSSEHPMLQAADLIAYITLRARKREAKAYRTAQRLRRILRPVILSEKFWVP